MHVAKKHILFLTWKDMEHPHAGGAEKVMHEYARRFASHGYRVTWFTSSFAGAAPTTTYDGIEVIRKYSAHTIWLFAWFWYIGWKKKNTVDIIIDEAWGWPLLSPLYENSIPLFFFTHHIGDKEFDEYPFPIGALAKWIYHRCISVYKNTRTIAVSYSTRDELIKHFGFRSDSISVVENTVEVTPIEQVDMSVKTYDYVFLWRLTRIKRPLDAIRAFAKSLPMLPPESHLHIIGNPQDEKYYEEILTYIKKHHLTSRVIFHGFLPTPDAREIVRRSRAIIVPSEKEWYGLVVPEANALGTPAIVYSVPGLEDSTKDWVNGMLVPAGDTDTLSKTMLEMISEKEKYEKLCQTSLEYSKQLPTWDIQHQELSTLIFSKL